EGVFRAANGVTQPIVVSKTDLEYSEEARIAKIRGTVKVAAVVGVDGKVRDIQVVKSAGLGLDENAVGAVGKWGFKPGLKDGMPVPVMVDIELNFFLGRGRGEWILSRAVFNPPEGATRPAVTMAPYPSIYTPAGRTGSQFESRTTDLRPVRLIAISFDVNPNGTAENLHIEKSSDPALESEVIRIVRGWQFRPGMKGGQPVSVPCTLEFVEGSVP